MNNVFEPDGTALEHADCPITGTYSCWSNGTAGGSNWMFFNDDAECADTEKVTIDFKFALSDDQDASGNGAVELLVVRNQDSTNIAWFWVKEDISPIRMDFECDGTGTDFWNITVDTVYNIRVDVDTGGSGVANKCTIYVDTESSGDWGSGGVKSSGELTGSTTADTGVGGFNATDETLDQNFIVDDIAICDTIGGFLAAGTQCKR